MFAELRPRCVRSTPYSTRAKSTGQLQCWRDISKVPTLDFLSMLNIERFSNHGYIVLLNLGLSLTSAEDLHELFTSMYICPPPLRSSSPTPNCLASGYKYNRRQCNGQEMFNELQ